VGVIVEGIYMGEGGDETSLTRAVCWRLCDAKDSCGCAPLYEDWAALLSGGERETTTSRALEWLRRSMRALPTSLLMGTDVGRKMAGGYTASRSAIDLIEIRSQRVAVAHGLAHMTPQKERRPRTSSSSRAGLTEI